MQFASNANEFAYEATQIMEQLPMRIVEVALNGARDAGMISKAHRNAPGGDDSPSPAGADSHAIVERVNGLYSLSF